MLKSTAEPLHHLEPDHEFAARHVGLSEADQQHMLQALGLPSRQALVEQVVPPHIARHQPMQLPNAVGEAQALAELRELAARNQVVKSCIGQGYHNTHTPGVILRNVLENPAWYTAYTPYQAEISQGRMEALINFQTMVCDLTAMPIANASMLDEATAVAEAMTLAKRSVKATSQTVLVCQDCHPQTLEVLQTRAEPLGLSLRVLPAEAWRKALDEGNYFVAITQYPATCGAVRDWHDVAEVVHGHQAALVVAADLLALTLLTPPGEWGADIVVGSTQRFGMPMGNGGPHAAYMACRDEYKRSLPGRLVGVSVDAHGNPAYRLALQTREQHIRREKATSNICTAQVLPAVVASMYAVYHGADGLRRIAQRVASYTAILAQALQDAGAALQPTARFDTLALPMAQDNAQQTVARALAAGYNLRLMPHGTVGITLDETTTRADLNALLHAVCPGATLDWEQANKGVWLQWPEALQRRSNYLQHPVFHQHRSETAMLRYLRRLSDKDIALDRSMIPLGSCTMKLNATSEMIPITWPEFAHIHPFAPADQRAGYTAMAEQLCQWLAQATGYAGVSLQPNAGSQGEYAGLLVIQAWQRARGQGQRNVCLIPASAHGTNPASAHMVGMQVVVVACDAQGNIDLNDLRTKCQAHANNLAALMITYPSTHGVFESHVQQVCELVHEHGGRVYVDGANLNALVGLAAPGHFGGDVSHLNLHKTFCIPHGGGGPGVGPVCVVEDLVPYLPAHRTGGVDGGVGAVSAAPLGNAAVLPISWMYCRMMGSAGLQQATECAILSANYISAKLKPYFPTLYTGANGWVAHECILDCRDLKARCGITAEDVAKRLMDYGFHAPTLSFPVANTLMVEPTESEPLVEIERFIQAMQSIANEIQAIERGDWPQDNNPLKHAPHTAAQVTAQEWLHPYSRETAAFAVPGLYQHKIWPSVGRVDNVHGDRHLFCSCIPLSEGEIQ